MSFSLASLASLASSVLRSGLRSGAAGAGRIGGAAWATLAALSLLGLQGCTPSIGDGCVVSTDCSTRGDRVCDTSQPSGYCTVLGCRADSCPEDAACVLFEARVPGCGPDGRELSRTGRSLCVKTCEVSDDCRPGYRCVDPRIVPIHGIRLEAAFGAVCLPEASLPQVTAAEPAVCKPAN
ncbi:MAG: hypothetical protein U0174_04800 [Polyangiaceae bacterium]